MASAIVMYKAGVIKCAGGSSVGKMVSYDVGDGGTEGHRQGRSTQACLSFFSATVSDVHVSAHFLVRATHGECFQLRGHPEVG